MKPRPSSGCFSHPSRKRRGTRLGSRSTSRRSGKAAPTTGRSAPPPDDLVPDGIEHTGGLQSPGSPPDLALGDRLGLGLLGGGVTAGGAGHPELLIGISCDRDRALL